MLIKASTHDLYFTFAVETKLTEVQSQHTDLEGEQVSWYLLMHTDIFWCKNILLRC